ncbi:MAG: hypothetical protein KDM64_11300, partial [Verrucomicrobiae bacterium]|nr:hypothetical protein [Verrucomicrobiae bacterium]
TLVTPEIFVGTEPKSRLYHYKLEEYRSDPSILLREWRRSYALMAKRKDQPGWEYPDDSHIESLLRDRFSLRHLSFEELFCEAPRSEFSPLMEAFLQASNGASRRFGAHSFP